MDALIRKDIAKFYFQSQPGQSWFRNVSLDKNASFRLALILNLGL